ncbi:hypothetical protein HanXRQr2_Chr11g0491171 [Helianthus annuus]|uniref:Uncharacterized protein n=1 Tax=Helianthus annuus TaxID=4232 RepID=A0A9K3HPK7_HELAN|nr:hypothetical protein HanXRQr2_Chr11g0491171 [Helianthus annuus]KAJ0875201.1 hypothetical protein HanPSC8_Chr11g0473351 [Helianthus annuus]
MEVSLLMDYRHKIHQHILSTNSSWLHHCKIKDELSMVTSPICSISNMLVFFNVIRFLLVILYNHTVHTNISFIYVRKIT